MANQLMTACEKYINSFIFAIVFFAVVGSPAKVCFAATIWCNPANSGNEDGLAKASGYTTLWNAIEHMAGGDIIIIADGDWRNSVNMYIDANHKPPDGTQSNYSKIRAESDWNVKLPYIHIESFESSGYLEFRGIVFDNKYIGLGIGHIVYHMHHTKFIRCGFLAHGLKGNVHTCGFGNSDPDRSRNQFNLMEECIAWGSGRYVFYNKYGQYNVLRRCIARHDYHDGDGGQDAGQIFNFRAYACDYSLYQNDISIDSDRIQYFYLDKKTGDTLALSSEAGGFWIGDSYGATGNVVDGCISIKDVHMSYYIGGNAAGTSTIKNSIALDVPVPGYTTLSAFVLKNNTNITAEHLLGFKALGGGQDGFYGKNSGTFAVSNSILKDVNEYGVLAVENSYINHYNAGSGSWGTGGTTFDPQISGLLYPVRIEQNSLLSTAGAGGDRCGPDILYALGRDADGDGICGLLYGEPGYDELMDGTNGYRAQRLWPFPNEDKIKELMSSTVEGVAGIYGFTAYISPSGSPNTLTSYIWEYLGNSLPQDIYGSSNTTVPMPPSKLTAQ